MVQRAWTLVLQETLQQSAWQRMDAADRSRVFLMLASLILLGLLLMVLAWFGGRLTRRYINRQGGTLGPRSGAVLDQDAWAKKPLGTAEDIRDLGTSRTDHE